MKKILMLLLLALLSSFSFGDQHVFTFYKIPVALKGELNQNFINKAFVESLAKSNYELLSSIIVQDGTTASSSKVEQIRYNESISDDGAPKDFITFDTGFSVEITSKAEKNSDKINLTIDARNTELIEWQHKSINKFDFISPLFACSSMRTQFSCNLNTPILLFPRNKKSSKDEEIILFIMTVNKYE